MDNVDRAGWITSLISPAIAKSGATTQIVVGLTRNPSGGLIFALRIGQGDEVTVPEQAVFELIANERLMMTEKLVRENRISRPGT
jgi:hypothetical protein